MSKADNLKDFLTDVADAIRAKKGTTDLINPQNFSAEIASLSGGLEVIEMTETAATIEPNKVYVWGMVESLNITLGASTDASDFFAFRFRCSKPTMTSVTVNGATWADDTELDAGGKPVLDLGSWYQCEIKGGTSALYARLAHYIPFEDSNVEAVLMSKGVGDGIGITYKDAAKVTSISTWFKENTDITSFAEFVNFSGISLLADSTFYGCSSLTEITLPAGVTSIGNHAFNGCKLLARVLNLENTKVTKIGNGVFNGCATLAEVSLPASLTSIGPYAFQGCSSLIRVVNFEKTQLTSIYDRAFEVCTSLAEITLPASLTSIGNYAFRNCTSLAEITLPASLTSIGDYAFRNCTSLAGITLPASLTSIGDGAFNGCKSLTSVVNFENTQLTSVIYGAFSGCTLLAGITLPDTLTSIYDRAFEVCSSLTEITLPAGVTSIGNYAFNGCTSLAGITLPASLTSIGDYAFRNCTSLAGITLPDTLTSIGGGAFNGCKSLQYIRIEATTPPTLSNTDAIPSTIRAIYVPDASVEAYQAATNWSSFASKIKGISEMPA